MARASLVLGVALGVVIALLGALDTVGEALWEKHGGGGAVEVRRPPADEIPSGSELDLIGPLLAPWLTR